MTLAYDDGQARFFLGDVRAVLREIEAESVQCVVSSPPYWGLRDYGTAQWEGGDARCAHKPRTRARTERPREGLTGGTATIDAAEAIYRDACGDCGARRIDSQLGLEPTPEMFIEHMVEVFREVRRVLAKDGTLWLNIGDSYAGSPVGTFNGGGFKDGSAASGGRDLSGIANGSRMSKVVSGLKPKDLVGIPWALAKALRDPYYSGRMKAERDRVWLAAVIDSEGCISGFTHNRADGGGTRTGVNITITNTSANLLAEAHRIWPASQALHENHGAGHYGGKPSWRWICNGNENRMLLLREIYPYLVAKRTQALLAYNLCLFMADAKRMGKAAEAGAVHEKRQLLARLISEANQGDGSVAVPAWCVEPPSPTEPGFYLRQDIIWAKPNPMPESVTDRCTKSHEYLFLLTKSERYYYDSEAIRESAEYGRREWIGGADAVLASAGIDGHRAKSYVKGGDPSAGRNRRSVWTIATEAFPESHFATFPQKLVEPCILAGTSEHGCCSVCGAQWERVVERGELVNEHNVKPTPTFIGDSKRHPSQRTDVMIARAYYPKTTTGWRATCAHTDAPVRPAVVLDPFLGSGTTAMVAKRLGRRAVGIDLNAEYLEMAKRRCAQMALMPEEMIMRVGG